MENVTVYEYLLDKDKIIKVVHKAKIQGNRYVFDAGRAETTPKRLHDSELGIPMSNHIFALEDNFSKYEKAIIEALEKRFQETEKRQIKRREVLAKLKESCSSREENHGVQGTTDA